jgi:hypothetical protein
MAQTSKLEVSAERFVRLATRVGPKMTNKMGAVVARGNVMTELHNRDLGHPIGERKSVGEVAEHAWAVARFAGSVAIHMPGFYVAAGRLWRATNSFEDELKKTMPEAFDRVEHEETDYLSVAAELVGIDAEAALNEAFAATGSSSVE